MSDKQQSKVFLKTEKILPETKKILLNLSKNLLLTSFNLQIYKQNSLKKDLKINIEIVQNYNLHFYSIC